ncbi:MAG: hypothetical protein M1825_003606 [Sarcosagium campestre]|nr:MAG: hypothetical protein M1825_003606 [Sarcosagium campestre]
MILLHTTTPLLAVLSLPVLAVAQIDPDLVGTWTTKSRKVVTGPVRVPTFYTSSWKTKALIGFYDPVNDRLIEPDLTGISYSFTADGFYEEAYYRAIPNPADPSCPRGIMQFQHGKYTQTASGSLKLSPITVDGRQLTSDPCNYDTSIYQRYNQTETFKSFNVGKDGYNGMQRLNLFQFDGAPLTPMWLIYKPPQMLPTKTLNPTATATAGAKSTSKSKSKVKRDATAYHTQDEDEDDDVEPLNKNALRKRQTPVEPAVDPDHVWWLGVAFTALGGVGYLCF